MSSNQIACGIDFGTSNSTVALLNSDKTIQMAYLEEDKHTLPSVLFFHQNGSVLYGRAAIKAYLMGEEGRLLRSIKSILGTALMDEKTKINKKHMDFTHILAHFIAHLKRKAESMVGEDITNVVMGRPVHFHDNHPYKDRKAEDTLRQIALSCGFKNIEFQLEPIAAAYRHEQDLKLEKLALVIDLGGGTSDFTVMKLSPDHKLKSNRYDDILATYGIRVGGTNFDTSLSLKMVMPELGLGSQYQDSFDPSKHLTMPLSIYNNLSDWSQIYKAHTREAIAQTQDLKKRSLSPDKLDLLETIQEENLGYALLEECEKAKISLSNNDTTAITFSEFGDNFKIPLTRPDFEDTINDHIVRIDDAISTTLKDAGINDNNINLIIMTGGSSELPVVQTLVKKRFSHAELLDNDKFSSVGFGLAKQAEYMLR
ncbi:MAG: hypothetical protein CMP22_06935 [Rickettsiales bacterium]|nr:hypothetical protein [Rickettsiales bacterium]|tara:strand:+ start:81 stop:1358 length:1278 start_codon:yes stop_codon:yes gene_type:complete